VLGYVLGFTLVLTVLSPVIFAEVFADSLIVSFDEEFYNLGDSLTINGEIPNVGMPIIAMSENTFSKTISLDSPFYDKAGEYMVKLDYGQISENHYFIVDGELFAPEILKLFYYTQKKNNTLTKM
jgi:hypothetical protein